jgi:short-subunit dehydrogenase
MRLGRWILLLFLLPAIAGCAPSTHISRRDSLRLAGRTYVITGASSGFGRGVAERLGAEHANVVLAARRAELLEEVAGRVRAAGGQALVVPTDVSDPEQVERLATAATDRFGRIDVWVNDAAVGTNGRFWEIPVADHARAVDVNLKGVIYGSHAALRRFVPQGHGVLINLGSVESVIPIAEHASYASTKAAILALGRALNEEVRLAGLKHRVSVVTIMPWAVDTPFFQHTANYSGHADRMVLMDGPEKVVGGIIRASLYPREEYPVGWKAAAAIAAHGILPDLTEEISANIHRAELNKGSPVPPTSGSLHEPMEAGRGVEGGIRARMKEEDAAKKAQPPRR